MRRVVLTVVLIASLLPLVAACQRSYEEPPAGEFLNAEPCDCEEPCPDCICEDEAKSRPPCGEGKGKGKGKGKGSGGGA